MKRILPATVSLLLIASGGALAQSTTGPVSGVPVNAYGIGATFTVGNHTAALAPTPAVAGGTVPYDKTVTLEQLNAKIALEAQTGTKPTLFVNGSGLTVHTAAPVGVDTITRESDVLERNMTASLNLDPLPPSTVHPQPYLNIVAQSIVSSAHYTAQIPGTPSVAGATRFGTLTISGQLVNGAVLNFSGPIKPNTIVYETAGITIVLNRQITASVSACPACTGVPTSIAVDAISVTLNQATVDGVKVTGEITIGHSLAH